MVVTARKGLGMSLSSHSPLPLWSTLKKSRRGSNAEVRRPTRVQSGKKDLSRAPKYITLGEAEGHERC